MLFVIFRQKEDEHILKCFRFSLLIEKGLKKKRTGSCTNTGIYHVAYHLWYPHCFRLYT